MNTSSRIIKQRLPLSRNLGCLRCRGGVVGLAGDKWCHTSLASSLPISTIELWQMILNNILWMCYSRRKVERVNHLLCRTLLAWYLRRLVNVRGWCPGSHRMLGMISYCRTPGLVGKPRACAVLVATVHVGHGRLSRD